MDRSTFLATLATAAASPIVPRRVDDLQPLRAAIGQRGAWDTMIVPQGIEEGIFRRAGLDVQPTFTAGGSDTLQAVTTGSADVGIAVGTTGAIGAFAKGAPLRIISGEFTGASDIFFYVRADSPIRSMAQMQGRTLGFSRPGSSSFIAAHLLATRAGVAPSFVPAGETAATFTQVMSGQLDAGWAVPPLVLDALRDGKVRMLARASELPELRHQTVRVNVAGAAYARDHHDLLVRFVGAYRETVAWMYRDRRAALARYARYNGIAPGIAGDALGFYPQAAVATLSIAGFRRSLDDALAYKNITKPLDADQVRDLFDVVYTR